MKKNVLTADRIIRCVVAVVLVALYATGTVSGGLGIAALVVAAVMLVTAVVSFCPLYTIMGAMFGGNGADEDPHKSGVCCGHCGSEDSGKEQQSNDGPPILS